MTSRLPRIDYLFSKLRHKWCGSKWDKRWQGTERSRRRENYNQNIWEKIDFNKMWYKLIIVQFMKEKLGQSIRKIYMMNFKYQPKRLHKVHWRMMKWSLFYIKTTIIYRNILKSDMFTLKLRLLVSKPPIQNIIANLLKIQLSLGRKQSQWTEQSSASYKGAECY